ncbi:MAG: putative nitrogen fixation protein NifT [cyanobacterium endosymbiont of Rhopalodia sterrenbergii]
MKVILSRNDTGSLSVYVPKKDLEEVVVNETPSDGGKVLTLANGWDLKFPTLTDDTKLPQTMEATKL